MYTSTTFLIAAISSLASALPTSNIVPRAGGPAITPIPSTCAVTSPMPASNASYMPAPATKSDILYSAYYSAFSSNTTAMAQQCLEQCYGYGYHVECKTAYWAQNVAVPAGYYGTAGGQLETACLMFNRALTSDDFVVAPEGQGTDAVARNIVC
ncbi:hypothetical protein A1F94_002948 [Pyrenophora tritici-repentis]|uniref:Uncharacterized protein n=2 Tax=Pyrenophora tritici-repentis TaxID=45151 RepID=A0A2W1HGB2_9PLEO|nr:uncharacterized protein PTRG_03069 [Pyrenophora tritici-repentis Pt-1C-BFP]KAA8622849.1 hypothetical protein PtrV1_04155 [Pyrenophora tritici-repentis]EDU45592.1 conserved hypothetical protein [Pyrenophora tritici-repentis Pt-1C-BFP]KAF7451840.1 hypothetical protein A1F99_036170 [Pyrenophora tritici-repentis]KAF7575036.1 hypothetical protein PtrM4_066600 [Pyrenophora tritici-repentis]KAG9386198.1 hypothetical protein A1F94_002948 [Pyrenophora tritici-repentis]